MAQSDVHLSAKDGIPLHKVTRFLFSLFNFLNVEYYNKNKRSSNSISLT